MNVVYPRIFNPAGTKRLSFAANNQEKAEGISRRDFLVSTGAALTGAAVAGGAATTGFSYVMKPKTLPELVEAVGPSTVTIIKEVKYFDRDVHAYKARESTGSGIILRDSSKNLLIITNRHVIKDNELKDIKTGKKYYNIKFFGQPDEVNAKAELVFYDEERDLAVLKFIDTEEKLPDSIRPVKKFSKELIKTGDPIFAIGSPYGERDSVSSGIISHNNRKLKQYKGEVVSYQIDAAINPGNSGGPLFDMQGNLVGINTDFRSANNISYSITMDTLKEFFDQPGNKIIIPGLNDRPMPEIPALNPL